MYKFPWLWDQKNIVLIVTWQWLCSENLVLICTSPNLFHQSHSLKQCLHNATESETVSRSVVSSSLQPHELKPIRLLSPWNFPGQTTGVGSHSLLQGSSQPRDRTQVSHLQADSLPAEPQGKPKNTRVGSLSFLQGIFLTQESNQGLLHCRQILNQLGYEGNRRGKGSVIS